MTAIQLQLLIALKHECEMSVIGETKVMRFCVDVGLNATRYICQKREKDMSLKKKKSVG